MESLTIDIKTRNPTKEAYEAGLFYNDNNIELCLNNELIL